MSAHTSLHFPEGSLRCDANITELETDAIALHMDLGVWGEQGTDSVTFFFKDAAQLEKFAGVVTRALLEFF